GAGGARGRVVVPITVGVGAATAAREQKHQSEHPTTQGRVLGRGAGGEATCVLSHGGLPWVVRGSRLLSWLPVRCSVGTSARYATEATFTRRRAGEVLRLRVGRREGRGKGRRWSGPPHCGDDPHGGKVRCETEHPRWSRTDRFQRIGGNVL